MMPEGNCELLRLVHTCDAKSPAFAFALWKFKRVFVCACACICVAQL